MQTHNTLKQNTKSITPKPRQVQLKQIPLQNRRRLHKISLIPIKQHKYTHIINNARGREREHKFLPHSRKRESRRDEGAATQIFRTLL